MANTVIVYPGDGVTRHFTVPFDYLNRTFVRVYRNEIEEAQGTTWNFITPTVIERVAAPVVGGTLTIRRVTSPNHIVDFKDASVLRSLDLNTSQLQVLHIAEEAKDMIVDTISTDGWGNLDARWRHLVHVANPVEDGDALNYGTYKADLNGAVVARDRAEAAATKAEASEVTAKNSANTASSHKVAAEGAATAAKASETTASTAAVTATTAAAAASTSASTANTEALAAKGWADSVNGQANIAKGWADNAKTDADRACQCADSVDTSVFERRVSTLETHKLDKSGGVMTGDLSIRGGVLKNSFDNLNFNTPSDRGGLVLEWNDGTGKTWDNAINAVRVYPGILNSGGEWMAGTCVGWKVNGDITQRSLLLAGNGKLMVNEQEARYVKQSYRSANNEAWYRIWSDNWIEQGGTLLVGSNSTLSYVTPFADYLGENRTLIVSPSDGAFGSLNAGAREASVTSFAIYGTGWGGPARFSWYACGF